MFDIERSLNRLAATRPIFHSEADFKHALAWQVQLDDPAARIRLETRPERGMRLDILIHLPDGTVAVELKYLVARFQGTVEGEQFDLPNQGAHDISRHDFIKDIQRVEHFVGDGIADRGWAVALTNDQNYWEEGWKATPIDAAFRIHEGRTLGGTLFWGSLAGAGTTAKRDLPLVVSGMYACRWKDYATISAATGKDVRLRYLALQIPSARDAGP